MLWLRRFIFVFPVLVLTFFVVAFVFVKRGTAQLAQHENILTMGSIGEPENVNPIRATTTAAQDVIDMVFNGLIKNDENLNLIGDLASGWDLNQSSRMFFDNEPDAEAALGALRKAIPASQPDGVSSAASTSQPDSREKFRLVSSARDGKTLTLMFTGDAGTGYQDLIGETLKARKPRAVWFVNMSPREGKTFPGGVEMSTEEIAKRSRQALNDAKVDATVVEEYRPLDASVELVGHGDRVGVEKALGDLFKPEDKKAGLADVTFENFKALDKPIYTFHLRKGVMWQDGVLAGKKYDPVEFTADDVKFTYDKLISPEVASPRASDYLTIESVKVLDRYTAEVTYKKPYSSAVLSWAMAMLPKHILDGKPVKPWWAQNFDRHPIGTGPYKFSEWRSGEIIKMVRNDKYFEGSPTLDGIWIRYIPEQINIKLALETGQIDFYSVEPYAVGRAKREKKFDLFEFESRSYSYIGWNLKNPQFKDVRVRRALAHAVNVKELIQYKLYGQAIQSTGIYTPQFWFWNPNIQPIEYDPDKAIKLLAEAGWTKDADGRLVDKGGKQFKFTLITNNANEIRRDIGVIVQSNLAKLGMDVKLELYEWSVFIEQHIDEQDFDACILGWSTGIDYDMYQLFHSSQAHPKQLNFCSYINPEADKLIEQLRTTFDHNKLQQIAWKLQKLIYDDQPYLWLDVPLATVALQKDKFRVYRPLGDGKWKDEPIRQVKAGFKLYLPYWYLRAKPPAGLAKEATP